jgi:hypothetical protein
VPWRVEPFVILDGVFRVLDDAAEAFVGVGNVIAAVEIIVDVNLPVAIQSVGAAIEVVEFFAHLQGRDYFRNLAQEILQRHGVAIEIDEHETFPGVHADGHEAVVGAFEIADTFEFHHAF